MPFYIESAQPEFPATPFDRSQAVPAKVHSTAREDYLPAAHGKHTMRDKRVAKKATGSLAGKWLNTTFFAAQISMDVMKLCHGEYSARDCAP